MLLPHHNTLWSHSMEVERTGYSIFMMHSATLELITYTSMFNSQFDFFVSLLIFLSSRYLCTCLYGLVEGEDTAVIVVHRLCSDNVFHPMYFCDCFVEQRCKGNVCREDLEGTESVETSQSYQQSKRPQGMLQPFESLMGSVSVIC